MRVNLKKKVSAMMGAVLVSGLVIGTSYASTSSWSVNLPAFKGNVDLCSGTAGGKSYATATCTSMGGSYQATDVWIRTGGNGSGSQITDIYSVYEGQGSVRLYYNNTPSKGTELWARGQNEDTTYVQVTSRGSVTF